MKGGSEVGQELKRHEVRVGVVILPGKQVLENFSANDLQSLRRPAFVFNDIPCDFEHPVRKFGMAGLRCWNGYPGLELEFLLRVGGYVWLLSRYVSVRVGVR